MNQTHQLWEKINADIGIPTLHPIGVLLSPLSESAYISFKSKVSYEIVKHRPSNTCETIKHY